jgi:hypothetical protein
MLWKTASDKKSGGQWAKRCIHASGMARRRKTPGTYEYNRSHYIGKAGEGRREQQWRLLRTPGSQRYKYHQQKVQDTIDKYENLLSLDKNDPEFIRIVRGGSING